MILPRDLSVGQALERSALETVDVSVGTQTVPGLAIQDEITKHYLGWVWRVGDKWFWRTVNGAGEGQADSQILAIHEVWRARGK